MKAKCFKCNNIWDYKYEDIKVEPDGHDLTVVLYCPSCGYCTRRYNPNDLTLQIEPKYVDWLKTKSTKYAWE